MAINTRIAGVLRLTLVLTQSPAEMATSRDLQHRISDHFDGSAAPAAYWGR